MPLLVRLDPGLIAGGTYFVAVSRDGYLLGAGGWSQARPGTGEIVPHLAHIRHFAVAPDATGNGTGRAIFEACRSAARRGSFECYSTRTAVPFYRALGFEQLGDFDGPMAPDFEFPSIRMIRRSSEADVIHPAVALPGNV